MSKIDEGIIKVLEDTNYSRRNNRKWLGDIVLETRPNRIYGVLRKNVFKFGIWETSEKIDIYGFYNIEKFIHGNKGIFCWYVVLESNNNKTNYIQTDDFYGPLHNSWGIYKLEEGIDVKEYSGLNHYNKVLDEQGRYQEKYKEFKSWLFRLKRFSRKSGISTALISVISALIVFGIISWLW